MAIAASVPLISPGSVIGVDAAERSVNNAGVRAAQVVVISSEVLTPVPTPVIRVAQSPSTDDRWWREATSGMSTTSIVKIPAAPPARVSEAIVSSEAPAAVRSSIATTPTPSPTPRATVRPAPFQDVRLSANVPAKIRKYEPLILRYAKQYDVDPSFVAAVINTESAGDPDAVSPMNAIGLMQVLDGPFDPEENIKEGVRLLGKYLTRYQKIDVALAAYNAGPGNVNKHGGVPPFKETHLHIARTMASYTAWKDRAVAA